MNFLSWKFGLSLVVILLGLQCQLGQSESSPGLPEWPPVSEPPPEDVTFTPPSWPPVSEPGEETEETDETDPDTDTTTPIPDPDPEPQEPSPNEVSNAWMVVAIVFIVLTVALAGIAIFLYVTLPKAQMNTDRTFVLPRANVQ